MSNTYFRLKNSTNEITLTAFVSRKGSDHTLFLRMGSYPNSECITLTDAEAKALAEGIMERVNNDVSATGAEQTQTEYKP